MMNHRTTKVPAAHNNSGLQALHDSTVRCLWSNAMPEPFTAEGTTAVAFRLLERSSVRWLWSGMPHSFAAQRYAVTFDHSSAAAGRCLPAGCARPLT